jgi:type I restriction enzyme, S subunit
MGWKEREMKKVKLKEVCSTIGDGIHGTPKYVEKSDYYFINGNNLKNGFIVFDEKTKMVSQEEAEKYSLPLNKNTLLMSINGTLGGLAKYRDEKIMLGKSAAYINCDKINLDYLFYYFQQEGVLKKFYNEATGSTIKNLSLNSLQNFEIPFPTLPTQTAIARVLSSLDDKIELNNKINKELENMAKMIYDYWFVQNADKRWEKGELSEIANITMGQSPDGNSYNEQGEGIIFYQGCTDFGLRFPTIRQYTTEPTRFAEVGDILLSVRAPVGTINFANKKCCIGRGLAALNSKIGSITHLYFILKDLEMVFKRRNTDGTTFGAITKDDLFSLSVTKPPKDVLIRYEKIAKPIFEKQFEIAKESADLAQLRDFLLPLLMGGEVGVG